MQADDGGGKASILGILAIVQVAFTFLVGLAFTLMLLFGEPVEEA